MATTAQQHADEEPAAPEAVHDVDAEEQQEEVLYTEVEVTTETEVEIEIKVGASFPCRDSMLHA